MRNPLNFFVELMKQPVWIPLWFAVLMAVNLASLAFWSEPLAQIVFIVFMVSSTLMMLLYSIFGFEKILGVGHVLWIPLLAYILIEISATTGAFNLYLIVLSVSLTISLVFDISDVWQYFSKRKIRSLDI